MKAVVHCQPKSKLGAELTFLDIQANCFFILNVCLEGIDGFLINGTKKSVLEAFLHCYE